MLLRSNFKNHKSQTVSKAHPHPRPNRAFHSNTPTRINYDYFIVSAETLRNFNTHTHTHNTRKSRARTPTLPSRHTFFSDVVFPAVSSARFRFRNGHSSWRKLAPARFVGGVGSSEAYREVVVIEPHSSADLRKQTMRFDVSVCAFYRR